MDKEKKHDKTNKGSSKTDKGSKKSKSFIINYNLIY